MAKLEDGTHLYPVGERKKYGERVGFKITELLLGVGQCIPWHRHSKVFDTFYVIEGRLRIDMEEPQEHVILLPTQTYTVIRRRPHRVASDNDESVRFLVIGDAQDQGSYDFEPIDH
jgi:mannose-6-phosphate isomerase-like protein (cupin superfamily)